MSWHIIVGTSPSFRVVFATGSEMTQNVGSVHQDPERIIKIQNTVVSFFSMGILVRRFCVSAEEKEGRRLVRPSQLPLYDESPEPRLVLF